jgi:hypothetical protein
MEKVETPKTQACTERTLKSRLKRAVDKANTILESKYRLEKEINYLIYAILNRIKVDRSIVETIFNLSREIGRKLDEAVESTIVSELKLDREVEKYETQYSVKFNTKNGRILGVILVRSKNRIKPVAVWTNGETLDYIEGEKQLT